MEVGKVKSGMQTIAKLDLFGERCIPTKATNIHEFEWKKCGSGNELL